MSSDWRSADALRDGGVLTIDDEPAVAGGSEPAVPASPRTPYSERPVARARRAKAQELIERLVAEGRVRITDPDDDEVAEWRRVANYAKRHSLEPAGKRIEKVPYGGSGLELSLADGPHPNARSQRPKAGADPVPAPSRLGNLHPIVTALKDDERRLVMPSALRRRSLLLLQGLAAEAVRRGYEVRKAGSSLYPREGGVDVAVDGFAYTVTVRQEFPESTDPERSVRLAVELAHGLTGRPGRWRDRKTRTLEEALGLILGEIEARAVEDARRRQEEQQQAHLVLQRCLWAVASSFVVAGAGLVLASPAPERPVQDLFDGCEVALGEPVDETAYLGEAQGYELGGSVSAFWRSSARARRTVRAAWAAMARVMWRCQPG
ncbi:hypothetical protein [Streptomyces sp. CO7]